MLDKAPQSSDQVDVESLYEVSSYGHIVIPAQIFTGCTRPAYGYMSGRCYLATLCHLAGIELPAIALLTSI